MATISRVQRKIKTDVRPKSEDRKWSRESDLGLFDSEEDSSKTVLMKPRVRHKVQERHSSHERPNRGREQSDLGFLDSEDSSKTVFMKPMDERERHSSHERLNWCRRQSDLGLLDSEENSSNTVFMKPRLNQRRDGYDGTQRVKHKKRQRDRSHERLDRSMGTGTSCSRCAGCFPGYDVTSCDSFDCQKSRRRKRETYCERGCLQNSNALAALVFVLGFLLTMSLSFIFWRLVRRD